MGGTERTLLLLVALLSLLGLFAAKEVLSSVRSGAIALPPGKKAEDPSFVVIDEWAGMLVSILTLPGTPLQLVGAFALFRFFDISKFGPIGFAERLPGAWGIMADDLVAGACAIVTLRLLMLLPVVG